MNFEDIPKKITRYFIKQHPEITFVYEDSLIGRSYEGQARECRGMPNCHGIPCCRCFDLDPGYRDFDDSLFDCYAFYLHVSDMPRDKPIYVLPGIGQTICKMPPKLYKYMIDQLNALEPINKGMF